jgi:hypothetical protein
MEKDTHIRGKAQVTFNDGTVQVWEMAPGLSLPGETMAQVLRLCLQGDIASIDPIQIAENTTP